ncbi:MAG: thrombospondin type 3 repeat-containing protein [Verrucomicrobiota bacterium]
MNSKQRLAICLFLGWCFSASAATTINTVNKHAYGANIGWINGRGDNTNGVEIGQFYCSGFTWGANVGWINFGSGPTNGCQYSNASQTDFGVNHLGNGLLRGMAYGANIGWINFETNGNPRVDLLTGNMSGMAYGANVGWISLSNLFAYVQTDSLSPGADSDNDCIPDAWELKAVGNLTSLTIDGDFDNDGFSDYAEYVADTDPNDVNSLLRISQYQHPGSTSIVTWASRPTRHYFIEQTDSLTNVLSWADSGLGLQLPDPGTETARAFQDSMVDRRYIRIRPIIPLSTP